MAPFIPGPADSAHRRHQRHRRSCRRPDCSPRRLTRRHSARDLRGHSLTRGRSSRASIERALAPAAAPVVIATAPAHVVPNARVTHTVVRGDTSGTSRVTTARPSRRSSTRTASTLAQRSTSATASSSPTRYKASAAQSTRPRSHKPQDRDCTNGQVRRHGVGPRPALRTTVAAITTANGLGSPAVIHVGDHLTIPGAASKRPRPDPRHHQRRAQKVHDRRLALHGEVGRHA